MDSDSNNKSSDKSGMNEVLNFFSNSNSLSSADS